MAFSRNIMPPARPSDRELTSAMAGIGMNFAARQAPDVNIEDTLIHASEAGMLDDDLRTLSVLTQWLGTHSRYVNADRLCRVVAEHAETRVRVYWTAIAVWLGSDRRFARLARTEVTPVDLLAVGTDFHLGRRGPDPRFAEGPLRVPAGPLRERESDVLAPEHLCRLHRGYRNRVQMGPSWRADVWTILEREPGLAVSEVSRRAYCGFATAWSAVQDFKVLHGNSSSAQVA